MAEPFIGEIRMFGGNFAPLGWALCEGQLLPIAQYDALYALIGTTYGGDGVTTFALPDLRGRIPVHQGTGPGLSPYVIGQQGGAENVTLTTAQMPTHTHPPQALNAPGSGPSPASAIWAGTSAQAFYAQGAPEPAAMNSNSISAVGSNQPHSNFQPYLCVNFIIALEGLFPTQG